MILDLKEIDYDFLEEEASFIITYRKEEFCDLAEKINLLSIFFEIVIKNKGEIVGFKDLFENEEDVLNAITELKLILENEDFQIKLFKDLLTEYKFLYKTTNNIENFLFMLNSNSIKQILSL